METKGKKVHFEYGDRVLNLPGHVVSMLERADLKAVRLLLLLASDPGKDPYAWAGQAGLTRASIESALSFWNGAGILTVSEEDARPSVQTPAAVLMPGNTVPTYTNSEIEVLYSKRPNLSLLIRECEKTAGKVFNAHEINIIIGLTDYLGLDEEYILNLLTYCISIGRKSMHAFQTMTFALVNDGIDTSERLNAYLRRREENREVEAQIKKLMGFGERALTAKEAGFIQTWTEEFGYDMEVIRMAYEQNVDTVGKPSLNYMNGILGRWHGEGYLDARSVHDLLEHEAEQRQARRKRPAQSGVRKTASGGSGDDSQSSFDPDEFMDAALKRSLKESEES